MLRQEVHILASRYHWSETDIFRLPTSRRKDYVKLILDDIEKEAGKA